MQQIAKMTVYWPGVTLYSPSSMRSVPLKNIMYTQPVLHHLGNRQLAIAISVPQLCSRSHQSPNLAALMSITSGRGSHSCSLIFFRASCFSQSVARAPDEVHDLSPTLTATTEANRATMPSGKPL